MTIAPQPLVNALGAFAATATAGNSRANIVRQIADSVIALRAGERAVEGQQLRSFFLREGKTLLSEIAASASILRMSEIDTIHRASMVTAGSIAVPLALSMHAKSAVDADRLIDAVFVGQEIAIRLTMACGGAKLGSTGGWPTYLSTPIGAAATAGRMLGLSADRMRHALALAIAQSTAMGGRSAGLRAGRWMIFGQAVRAGCVAAMASADGIDGDVNLLNETWLQSVAGMGDSSFLTSCGESRHMVDEMSFKPHCSAKQGLSAIHGLRQLLDGGMELSTIESIELNVPTAYAGMIDREPPTVSRLASMVSAPWQLALAALNPELLDDVSRHDFPQDPALARFASRISVKADPSLDALYPDFYPCRLQVTTSGGVTDLLVRSSPGDPEMPYDDAQVLDKCRRVLGIANGGGTPDDERFIRQILDMGTISPSNQSSDRQVFPRDLEENLSH